MRKFERILQRSAKRSWYADTVGTNDAHPRPHFPGIVGWGARLGVWRRASTAQSSHHIRPHTAYFGKIQDNCAMPQCCANCCLTFAKKMRTTSASEHTRGDAHRPNPSVCTFWGRDALERASHFAPWAKVSCWPATADWAQRLPRRAPTSQGKNPEDGARRRWSRTWSGRLAETLGGRSPALDPRMRRWERTMPGGQGGGSTWGKEIHFGKRLAREISASRLFLVWICFVASHLACDARRVGFCTHPAGRGIPGRAPPHLRAPSQPNRRRIEITIAHRTQSLSQPNPWWDPHSTSGCAAAFTTMAADPLCEEFAFRGHNLTGESAPGIA